MEEPYDLIISNPPFYTDTFKDVEDKRAIARHTKTLSFEELISATAKLLSTDGTCAFIIPFHEEGSFLEIAKKVKLYPNRITRVKGNVKTPTLKEVYYNLVLTRINLSLTKLLLKLKDMFIPILIKIL